MILGKIIKSNSHIDYLCRINDRLETATPPEITDYTFGKFVQMRIERNHPAGNDEPIIGIIYNSQLVNPEFGNYGPRLTTPPDQNAVFSPDYVNEQFTLVGILLLGWLEAQGGVHRIPPTILPLNTAVENVSDNDLQRFHLNDQRLQINYYPHVMTHAGKLSIQLMQTVLDRLAMLLSAEHRPLLDILRDTLSWQMTMTNFENS